jgi:hypothetical protein
MNIQNSFRGVLRLGEVERYWEIRSVIQNFPISWESSFPIRYDGRLHFVVRNPLNNYTAADAVRLTLETE